MDHAINLLLMHIPGVSATAKYFLVKVLYLGHEAAGRMSLDELSSHTRLTKQVVVRIRKELAEPVKKYRGGYLLKDDSVGAGHRGRGRPRKYFQLNPAFLVDLSLGGPDEEVVNAGVCRFLMQAPVERWTTSLKGSEGEAQADSVKDRLSALNLYFLTVLWMLADEMGAIWQKGVGEIAQLAGMTRTQAKNHLCKLKRMGYIDGRLPGVSGSLLFGRSPGATFLDPVHPTLAAIWGDVEWHWERYPNQDSISWAVWDAFENHHEKRLQGKTVIPEHITSNLHIGRRALEDSPLFREAWRELTQSEGLLGVYRVFTGVSQKVRTYARAVLYQYARKILQQQAPAIFESKEILDTDILQDLQRLVATNGDLEGKIAKGVALWVYSRAYVLAWEIFQQRAWAYMAAENDASDLSRMEQVKKARAALSESGEAWSVFPDKRVGYTRVLIKKKSIISG